VGYVAPNNDLDAATRGTFHLMSAAEEAGVRRVVLVSTLAFFRRHPRDWNVDASWRPRPTPDPTELCPWLAELSVREAVRAASRLYAVCVRLGDDVPEAEAAQAVADALAEPFSDGGERRWRIVHIGDAAGRPSEEAARPWRDVFAPAAPIASRPIKKVVVFGAGGPVAAVTADELARKGYVLRLTDLRPLDEIARENKPQSHGAPVARPLGPPHESRVVDVRDPDQVTAACEGMDAIINCTVVRPDPVEAFLVNTLGAYKVARAAASCGVRRVVHTGPQMLALHDRNDYSWDYDVPGDAPARPGLHLYGHSKYLGQEICRVFAEYYGLEVPVLLFSQFLNPDIADQGLYPMVVSWADTGRVIRAALEANALPTPYEEIHVTADVPHGRFSARRAKEVLGWEARDSLEHLWRRRNSAGERA
jgi:nucleoside-diphosphate-sugar epimerase